MKLRQPGPTPVRTYEFPLGIPEPNPQEQLRLNQSRELLHRAVYCLQHVHAAGGHGHLEAPPNAFTWYDPVVQSWLRQNNANALSLRPVHMVWTFPSIGCLLAVTIGSLILVANVPTTIIRPLQVCKMIPAHTSAVSQRNNPKNSLKYNH